METGGSLLCSQKHATCRYPEKLLHIINNQVEFGWLVNFSLKEFKIWKISSYFY
jgi:hypothetical protein